MAYHTCIQYCVYVCTYICIVAVELQYMQPVLTSEDRRIRRRSSSDKLPFLRRTPRGIYSFSDKHKCRAQHKHEAPFNRDWLIVMIPFHCDTHTHTTPWFRRTASERNLHGHGAREPLKMICPKLWSQVTAAPGSA